MSRKIIVCYLRADSSVLQDHVLNRMAAYMAPKYGNSDQAPVVHVELFFPNTGDDQNGLSAGICYGGQVFMHPKKFSRTNWEFHSIPVSDRQVYDVKSFLDRQRGASFNYRGFFAPRVCGIGHEYRVQHLATHKMQWYCSELAAYALMYGSVLESADAYEASSHPNATYHIIDERCNTFMDCARNIKDTKLSL